MTIANDQLADLVRRVRNNLWLREIARAGKAGLWVAAGVMAAGVVARWRFGTPTPAMLGALVSAPLLLTLALGLVRRPPWTTALAAADRRAGADALLLTACGLPPAPTGTAALALRQALQAAPAWEQRLRRDRHRPRVPLLPLGVMIAGAPLLALQPAASPSPPQTPIPVPRSTPAGEESLAQAIEQYRSAALATVPARRDTVRRGSGGAADYSTLPAEAAGDAAAQAGSAAAGGPTGHAAPAPGRSADFAAQGAPEPGGTGGTGRDVAGTGSRGPARPQVETGSNAAERVVRIARLGPANASAAGGGGKLDSAVAGTADSVRSAPPAALPEPGAVQPGAFGLAQRQLIARYFALREEEGR